MEKEKGQNLKNSKILKIGFLVSHPIQYHAPLFREIALDSEIEVKVIFFSDKSLKPNLDKKFNKIIKWDIPLLDGYSYEFLPSIGSKDQISFWRPLNYGLKKRLKNEGFDALIIHGYNHINCLRAIFLAKKFGSKIFLRGDSTLNGRNRSPLKLFFKKKLLTWLFSKIDGFLAVGQLNHHYYNHYGVSDDKIFSVPLAVDNRFFQSYVSKARKSRETFRTSLNLDKARAIILFAGKLEKKKNPMDLMEAYIKLSVDGKKEPTPYLVFVGDGDQFQTLEKKAKQKGWNSIRFLGFQNQTKLPAYFDLCDVFVLPSTLEPWGLIVNEVMNAGKPIVVSDRVGCGPDLVEDGVNGCIFPAGNILALNYSLQKILQNPDLASKMGQKSLEKINSWGFREDLVGLKQALHELV